MYSIAQPNSWAVALLGYVYRMPLLLLRNLTTERERPYNRLLLLMYTAILLRNIWRWAFPSYSVVSYRIGVKFGRIVLQVHTHRLTLDFRFDFDITVPRWRPWRHFSQKSAAIRWVHTQHTAGSSCCMCCCSARRLPAIAILAQDTSLACCSSWSMVHSYLLETSPWNFAALIAFDAAKR